MAKKDPWHFSRHALAREFVQQLDVGLASRMTLVAPRRKGKTEFLLFDLAPAAETAKYRVVYASLWANVNAPQQGLLEALTTAVDAKRKRRSITGSVLSAAVNKVKIDALGVGAELNFADAPVRALGDDTTAIDRLIEELSAGKRTKLLLIFDEIQHLGTEEAFTPLIYALRTSLDRMRDVRVVFSGSSRGGIRRMFGDQNAPFYGFATEVELPDLDRDFTDFLAKTFEKITKRKVNAATLWTQFNRLDQNPFYVREALKVMALEPGLPVLAAIERVLAAVAEQNDYKGLWAKLKPLDRALFLAIVRNPGGGGLHSQESVDELSGLMGKSVSRTLIGRRLQRLAERNLVSTAKRGSYQVEMPGFAEWVLRNDEEAKKT